MKTQYALLAIAIILAGCRTSQPRMYDTYPPAIEAMCIDLSAQARAGIEQIDGKPITKRSGCKVVMVPATHNIGGMWAYEYPGIGMVGGITMGGMIQVVADPLTGEVAWNNLFHEFGHYWLITAHGDGSHNPKYDSVFYWSGPQKPITSNRE